MTKYSFNIRTRSGNKVENIAILARDEVEAERRLRQMYPHCEVMECSVKQNELRSDTLDLEGIISLIAK